jgi:ACS family glucarate transporter-like MFS transporter
MASDDLQPEWTVRPSAQRPTCTRYWVLVFTVTLAVITYVDRVCISQAAPQIREALGLNHAQMGKVFGAFGLAYALCEIPGGRLGDWLGPRRVLTWVVTWWSFFTAATGWAWNLASLWVIRLLFGAGQAACFPNLTKVFTLWLTRPERIRAQGYMWLSARWGGAFTPLLVVAAFALLSWRSVFLFFGAVGVVWGAIFYWWFRDHPREHRSVGAGELELLQGNEANLARHARVPWGRLVASPAVWLLWAQYFFVSYAWYFYITWLPTYLQEARGVSAKYAAVLAGMPLFFGGFGCVASGFLTGWLVRRSLSMTFVRRLLGTVGGGGAAGMLLWSCYIQDPTWAMVAMGLSSFCNDLIMPGSWGACMDVGGRFAGTLSGSMNMMGNFGGMVGPVAVGYILQNTARNWEITFWLSSAACLLAAVCWLFIDPVTPLEGAKTQGPAPVPVSREPVVG